MKTALRWVLAAALMISGLEMFTSCANLHEFTNDVLCQWISDYPEEGTDPVLGEAYNRVVEVYEFFDNGTGYYECYYLDGDNLVSVEYVRGGNGDFSYVVTGDVALGKSLMLHSAVFEGEAILTPLDLSEPSWTLIFADGHFTDPGGCVYTPSTKAQQAQVLYWYEHRNDPKLAEKIIGKWMMGDLEGQALTTNDKAVFSFVSPTKAYMSASIVAHETSEELWSKQTELAVNISGNKVTLTNKVDAHRTSMVEFTVSSITDSQMQTTTKIILIEDGQETVSPDMQINFDKVTADYSQAILGLWEGHVTSSEGSVFDDGEDHRWEYKADGTYVYYIKSGEAWVPSGDPLNEYFVDGNLLCTRWKNAGQETENREWWIIESIENGVMKWTALRQKADRTTFTATFSMTKVQ